MNNTIPNRIADFLQSVAPFHLLTKSNLLHIAEHVVVKYLEANETIFQKDEALHDQFYLLHKGAIGFHKELDGEWQIIDHYAEGDVFGLRLLFARENYVFSAITEEETMLYCIPIKIFRPIAEEDRDVSVYLMESFASNTENPYSKKHLSELYSAVELEKEPTNQLFELQPVNFEEQVVTVTPNTSIKQAALTMRSNQVGSVVVCENQIPVGIVTNNDLRNKVATGDFAVDEAVSRIMTSPVLCYSKNLTIAQAQTTMLKHHVSHLCITEDGTPNTPLIGIVAQEDIVVMQANNPSSLMKAIQRTSNIKELKHVRTKVTQLLKGYIMQNLPLTHTSKIIFELNDATIKQIIEWHLEELGQPPVSFAWISLGSQGRKEQLLQTDQDNAIVYDDVEEGRKEDVKAYFLQLAKQVTNDLNDVGFSFCKADMMARNPSWCLSLAEWKEQFRSWTYETGNEELLLANSFFDFDISYGDASLTNALSDTVFELVGQNNLFLGKMASNAIRSASPLGFFRQFLVEKDGKHKNQFDLKNRALLPLIDAGRVLALHQKIKNTNNTAQRFERLAQLEPENEELFLSCSYAFKALLKFRTKHGLQNNDNGQFIEIETMMKEEKMKLKRCFKTISSIQELIKIRFQINALV